MIARAPLADELDGAGHYAGIVSGAVYFGEVVRRVVVDEFPEAGVVEDGPQPVLTHDLLGGHQGKIEHPVWYLLLESHGAVLTDRHGL
jgi:hypothetical protein